MKSAYSERRSLTPVSLHNQTREEKLARLNRWISWRKAGYRGHNLSKRTKMSIARARELAAELDVSLEGII